MGRAHVKCRCERYPLAVSGQAESHTEEDAVIQAGGVRQCLEAGDKCGTCLATQIVENLRHQRVHVREVLVNGTERHAGMLRQMQRGQRLVSFILENLPTGLLERADQGDRARLARLLAQGCRHFDMHQHVVGRVHSDGVDPGHKTSSLVSQGNT
ncbi:hypothetical protein D3C79_786030 [compost metagenome]